VALSVTLILVLNGFLAGVYRQSSAYLDNTPGSVAVLQDGVKNFFLGNSLLPSGTVGAVRDEGGVSKVVPLASQFAIFELHGKKQGALMVGYDPKIGGGPWKLAEGRDVRTDDEVVVDLALARAHELVLGDEIEVAGRDFEVVGISEGTSMWAAGMMFARKGAVDSLLRAPGATSVLLITPEKGITPEELRDRLSDVPGTDAMLKDTVARHDQELFAGVLSAPLRLMVGIAALVGALVVGLVTYTATVERQKEYGVLKAIGARNRVLYWTVATQAFIAAGLGAAAGVGLAYGAARLITILRPQFFVVIEARAVGLAVLVGLAMALVGALFPARAVAGLAPAEVFRR
jgi:putative ABC transport system permease protein